MMLPIPGFPGYLAGDDGNIYSCLRRGTEYGQPTTPRPMRPIGDGSYGYRRVTLRKDGKRIYRRVGVLVCSAFHGPRPVGMEVCHGIGGRLDDRPPNLSWGTHSRNMGRDRVRDGTDNRGEKQGSHKLTPDQVLSIRSLSKEKTGRSIAKEFGIGTSQVSMIVNGKSWGWLTNNKEVA